MNKISKDGTRTNNLHIPYSDLKLDEINKMLL